MKPNDKHHWKITLIGRARVARRRCRGDIGDALHAADVEESGVPFVVLAYHIARGARVRTSTRKEGKIL